MSVNRLLASLDVKSRAFFNPDPDDMNTLLDIFLETLLGCISIRVRTWFAFGFVMNPRTGNLNQFRELP
jgi:hypothetical protein